MTATAIVPPRSRGSASVRPKLASGNEARMESRMFASQDMTAGELNALVKVLGGDKIARAIIHGTLAVQTIAKVWTNLYLGTFADVDAYISTFIRNRLRTTPEAVQMLRMINYASKERLIKLFCLSIADLDIHVNGCVTLKDVLARAEELGFELCPPEVGPALAINRRGDTQGYTLQIMMKGIELGGEDSKRFSIRDGWLETSSCKSNIVVGCSDKFIFTRK